MIEVWPVIHLPTFITNPSDVIANVLIAARCSCAGVFLICHGGNNEAVDSMAKTIRESFPTLPLKLGANYLGHTTPFALVRSQDHGFDATWSDNHDFQGGTCTLPYDHISRAVRNDSHRLFAGVAFKGQPYEFNAGKAARAAIEWGAIPTTSGMATGRAARPQKLAHMRAEIPCNAPLALASGVTPDNVGSYVEHVTHILVASGVSRTFHDLDEDELRLLMKRIGQ